MSPALVTATGEVIDLPVDRWRDHPDEVELSLLTTVTDPVLDVGCGPGRIVGALAAAGRVVLGLDTSPRAVAEARQRRAPVLQRSVFGPLPGERRWGSVLLLDGNVGIGGDPRRLLRRCAELLRPGGEVLVELEPPGTPTRAITVRLRSPLGHGPWFPWALAGVDGLPGLAVAAGLAVAGCVSTGGRWYGRVLKP
ncbi:MAG: class I SAM-dependent methyltransferase [Acidimicrobiales bacterium]